MELLVEFPSHPLRLGRGSCLSLKKSDGSGTKVKEEEDDDLHPSQTHYLKRTPLLPPPPF